jgi:hypothetical protein
MTPDAEVPTFRDFAGGVMSGDHARAARALEVLLEVTPEGARAATAHFSARMGDPAFLPRAMSLRAAVADADPAQLDALLADCFGLDGAARTTAVAALRRRYPAR